jgi:hypothetical protein
MEESRIREAGRILKVDGIVIAGGKLDVGRIPE